MQNYWGGGATDDAEITEIARRSDALVPWLRRAELASDSARSVDVYLHALEWFGQVAPHRREFLRRARGEQTEFVSLCRRLVANLVRL